jgi:hypothetical protein
MLHQGPISQDGHVCHGWNLYRTDRSRGSTPRTTSYPGRSHMGPLPPRGTTCDVTNRKEGADATAGRDDLTERGRVARIAPRASTLSVLVGANSGAMGPPVRLEEWKRGIMTSIESG